jgi:hypothetical protein
MALWAWSNRVLVTGIYGASRTAYQPAFFSWTQLPDTLPVRYPCHGGDVVDKVAEPLPQRKHPQALTLSHPVQ